MKANEENQTAEAKQPTQDAASLFKTLLDKAVTLTDPVDRAQTLAQVAALSQQATSQQSSLPLGRSGSNGGSNGGSSNGGGGAVGLHRRGSCAAATAAQLKHELEGALLLCPALLATTAATALTLTLKWDRGGGCCFLYPAPCMPSANINTA